MTSRSFLTLILIAGLLINPLLANKAAVSIVTPAAVKAGQEVTVIIQVSPAATAVCITPIVWWSWRTKGNRSLEFFFQQPA